MPRLNMRNRSLILIILSFVPFGLSCDTKKEQANYAVQAIEESMIPVRPGIPGEQPFWNDKAVRFIYVPAFDFKEIAGAQSYKLSAFSLTDEKTYTFIADKPWQLLIPIWQQLPVGKIQLLVEALDADQSVIGIAGSRKFYKAAAFNGPYQGAILTYKESAKLALQKLFHEAHIQNWSKSNEPDTSYKLYCYPSKIIGAVTEGMLLYAGLNSEDSLAAMTIARRAADFLIGISEPADAPLAYFPRTYRGNAFSAAWFNGQIMLNCPADAARIYLDLYDVTADQKYYQAALRIAETYLKLQLANGTWQLKLSAQSGKPVDPNEIIPINIIGLFDRLIRLYDLDQYQAARDRAVEWINQNPLKTFNWEGQFEDIILQGPYQNLTKHEAAAFAIYLLDPERRDSKNIQTTKELARFAEDQFVIWERPLPDQNNSFNWLTPCVLEQYRFYEAVDASASKLIATYQALYEATDEDLYLAKAISLANNMTVIQKRYGGRYSTWWRLQKGEIQEDWINCAVYDVKTMLRLDALLTAMNDAEAEPARKNLLLLLSSPPREEIVTELVTRYGQTLDPVKKADLLRFITQSDSKADGPLLRDCILAGDESLKIKAISLLGLNRPINELELFQDVLNSKSEVIREALSHSYTCVAENYLTFGNEFPAREYFHLILNRPAAYFDKRLALKRLGEIGTFGSLKYIQPFIEVKGLSEIAASSWLTILQKNPDQLPALNIQDVMRILSKSMDPEIEKKIVSVLKKNKAIMPESFRKSALQNGFITDWWVAGPFPGKKQNGEVGSYFPEDQIEFSQTGRFDGRLAAWTSVRPHSVYGMVSLDDLYGKIEGIAYVYTEVSIPEAGEFVFRIGSNDGIACRVNGEWHYSNLQIGRALKLDEDSFRMKLNKGKNSILLKIPNLGGNWEVCLRLNDARDNPLNGSWYLPVMSKKSLIHSQQNSVFGTGE